MFVIYEKQFNLDIIRCPRGTKILKDGDKNVGQHKDATWNKCK